MKIPRSVATAVALAGAIALGACAAPTVSLEVSQSATPAPTPVPTATPAPAAAAETLPDLATLRFTADGLGTLLIGAAPSTGGAAIIVADPTRCSDSHSGLDYGIGDGDPEALRWVDVYTQGGQDRPFSVDVTDNIVTRIDNRSGLIPTDRGIVEGDTFEKLMAAYPEATPLPKLTPDDWRLIYAVEGTGWLLFEFALEDLDQPDLSSTIVSMRVVAADGYTGPVYGTDFVAGSCI